MGYATLGIDIGSVSVSVVRLHADGSIADVQYENHGGRTADCLRYLLSEHAAGERCYVAVTSPNDALVPTAVAVDPTVAFVTAARARHPDLRTLFIVGGEKFARVLFDADGRYNHMWRNTSCAAGTGSFLDQQARRLGLADSGELSRLALSNNGSVPVIASRCSVFAKTDIIHAQQEGYGLQEICDGLCQGLARNLLDTLAAEGGFTEPAFLAGGISRNSAVLRHLNQLSGSAIVTDSLAHVYGALGAALFLRGGQQAGDSGSVRRSPSAPIEIASVVDSLAGRTVPPAYDNEPIVPRKEGYPDFESGIRQLFEARALAKENPVEVEEFESNARTADRPVFIGIDIGSTSTKAVAVDAGRRVIAGFYTRTAGQPLRAVQGVFEAAAQFPFRVLGAATTGAGRKFSGAIIGADLIVDEITAHARAACELDPRVDTIIEIGGQDAKYTTLRNGIVTFSHMNTVCAAGTGSFLEEQAARLSTDLADYSELASGVRAPLASDRCTVFMERDINHLMQRGYDRRELLAAALHSVRENYIQKVAGGTITGTRICFQGATARNHALVAAFEQKLGKPIAVSRFCHLTGAFGAALLMIESPPDRTTFRGFGLYRDQIEIRSERCDLCANNCRLRIAQVDGAEVAYGFLCGRDYETRHFVDRNRSGFSLLKSRRSVERMARDAALRGESAGGVSARAPGGAAVPSIGLPAALQVAGEYPFWDLVFRQLNVKVVSGAFVPDAVAVGKRLYPAEFCTPIRDLFGQAIALLDRADCVFVPYLFRHRESGLSSCYYTQYTPSLLKSAVERAGHSPDRIVSPVLPYGIPYDGGGLNQIATLLERELNAALGRRFDHAAVVVALERAESAYREMKQGYRRIFRDQFPHRLENGKHDISVVLLGRPYTVLSPQMNKRIPQIFAEQGVRVFFQDMIPALGDRAVADRAIADRPSHDADELSLSTFPWQHAAEALQVARYCGETAGLYPVYVSSFRCSPDSFGLEYFRKMMDARAKPYLILQLDEHDSSIGYETRIEAAVSAFRNHRAQAELAEESARPVSPPTPSYQVAAKELRRKTLLLPGWNTYATPLLAAAMRRRGYDARVLPETQEIIRASMARNSGQCIPVNAIAEETAKYVDSAGLDPERTVLWMIKSNWSCNIPLYPKYIQTLLRDASDAKDGASRGLDRLGIFAGVFTFEDISPTLPLDAYFAYLFGGMLARLACRIRPYEMEPGATDRAVEAAFSVLLDCFEGRVRKSRAVRRVEEIFGSIEFDHTASRPKVAIFGDLYVRDNVVFNQDLVRTIERAGGEAIITSYSDYAKIIAPPTFSRLRRDGELVTLARYKLLLGLLQTLERRYMRGVVPLVGPVLSYTNRNVEVQLDAFHLRLDHEGESAENILKVLNLLERYPDISLFVQASPAFCCPALVTEAMSEDIERMTGVPVLSITYDGTGANRNDVIFPYLALREGSQKDSGARTLP